MMKKILFISLISFVFSCEKKQEKNLSADEKIRNSPIEKPNIAEDKKSFEDSIKIPKPAVIVPHKIDEIKIEPIKCFPPQSIDCKDKGGNMENGFVTECIYKNYGLSEAYQLFREQNKDNEDGKFLEKQLPPDKHTVVFNDYPISVTYTYPKPNTLEIEIFFQGGVTTITFKEDKESVKVTTNHSPD